MTATMRVENFFFKIPVKGSLLPRSKDYFFRRFMRVKASDIPFIPIPFTRLIIAGSLIKTRIPLLFHLFAKRSLMSGFAFA